MMNVIANEVVPNELSQMGICHPLRILLAEDDIVSSRKTIRQLEVLGYSCDLAKDGNEVILLVDDDHIKGDYDVIFLDLSMPYFSGIECARAIRARIRRELQPDLIALTASTSVDEYFDCMQVGIDHYLSKPINTPQLADILLKCTQKISEGIGKLSASSDNSSYSKIFGFNDDDEFLSMDTDVGFTLSEKGLHDLQDISQSKKFPTASMWDNDEP